MDIHATTEKKKSLQILNFFIFCVMCMLSVLSVESGLLLRCHIF